VRIAPSAGNLFALAGAVNSGVLVAGRRALVIDPGAHVTLARLRRLGIDRVEQVLLTSHRRTGSAGAAALVRAGAELVVPAAERALIERPQQRHWSDWRTRWHTYAQRPGPLVPAAGLPVTRTVTAGDTLAWGGFRLHVLSAEGPTDGGVAYVVEHGPLRVAFCGDLIFAPGQILDLHSLQRGFGCICDYHGFLGALPALRTSLAGLRAAAPTVLVPARGTVMHAPDAAIGLLEERLAALWRNYCGVSALNFYFPDLLADTRHDPGRLPPGKTLDLPPFVRRVAGTAFAVIADSGAALLTDCGQPAVLETVRDWLRTGAVRRIDGVWVTHYHDDHVDCLQDAALAGWPILADASLVEVLEHPARFFLPCLSPRGVPVTRPTADGESWAWEEFRLTAFHFPGQTLYHGGLLVEGHGTSVLFVGDSFAPTGLDDYCAQNRNLLGAGRGLRRCLALIRERQPAFLINAHQERAFRFTAAQFDALERTIDQREALLRHLLPWPHPNFGTDEHWVRTWPYDQETAAGDVVTVDVRFSNHGPKAARATAAPVLPPGWRHVRNPGTRAAIRIAAGGEGRIPVRLQVPSRAAPGLQVVPFDIGWNGCALGPLRHALVRVR
jgi:glyoxylase-like metal-dependent hydrolase (beta-lactamase superfamily II)